MTATEILQMRLRNQLISEHEPMAPGAVVARLGAVQAQDLLGAKWAIALRTPHAHEPDIEQAIAEKRIVRTWPMRGTLHFVSPDDVRWMLALMTPRVIERSAYRDAQLGLDDASYSRSRVVFEEQLSGGVALTRAQMLALLEEAGVRTDGQRGYHILWRLAQEGLVCFGPMQGKAPTFVLLDEWLPPGAHDRPITPDEPLALIAERFFTGHGPATVRDLARWTGLTLTEARAGLASVADRLTLMTYEGEEYWHGTASAGSAAGNETRAWLLPPWDEYVVGYSNRRIMLGEHHDHYHASISANGMFHPVIVIDGEAVGTWKRKIGKRDVVVAATPFRRLSAGHKKLLAEAVERYGTYLGLPARLEK